MSARRNDPVDDEDLQDYIYGTIRRLERLAKRLEIFAEENDDPAPGPAPVRRGGTSSKPDSTG